MKILPIIFLTVFVVIQSQALAQESSNYDRDVAEDKGLNEQGSGVEYNEKQEILIIDNEVFVGQDSPEELNEQKSDSVDYNEDL
jgi:hypothetical protein